MVAATSMGYGGFVANVVGDVTKYHGVLVATESVARCGFAWSHGEASTSEAIATPKAEQVCSKCFYKWKRGLVSTENEANSHWQVRGANTN